MGVQSIITEQNHDIDKTIDHLPLPLPRKFGYARISTSDQSHHLQLDALTQYGCTEIITDTITGTAASTARPGLQKLLDRLSPGDTLIVYRLDRLGRNLEHLITTVNSLKEKGVRFVSLQEGFDTSTPMGQFIFHLFGALAEFEREIIRERVNAGIKAAKSRGTHCGRPAKFTGDKWRTAMRLFEEKTMSIKQICGILNMSQATFYRYVKKHEKGENG